jgi:transcriptional regulator with XRE-family HTH domain
VDEPRRSEDVEGQEAEALAAELRRLRQAKGLSLAELARRTHYSKSSWERWLNGRRPVPEDALARFAEAMAEDAEVIRARAQVRAAGEAAAATAVATEAPSAAPAAGRAVVDAPIADAGRPLRPWTTRRRVAFGFPAAVGVLGLATVPFLLHGAPKRTASAAAPAGASARASARATGAPCRAAGCDRLDPQTAGCGGDAVTLATQYVKTKITDSAPGDTVSIVTSAGETETGVIHYGLDAYSPMVDVPAAASVKVCGTRPDASGCTTPLTDLAHARPMALPSPSLSAAATP